MQYLEQEPLRAHTTFRIGGAAMYYVIPGSREEIWEAICFAKEKGLPFLTIGRGSNLLFSDEGYPGVVIEIGRGMEKVEVKENGDVCAQAGVSLSVLASMVARQSLTGLEFAGGIPGTLGGAVTMNAGAYGGEMKDCIVNATVLDENGTVRTLTKEELELGYRTSVIQKEKYIVLGAELHLQPGEKEKILSQMKTFNAQRREKQPLEYPSAGSTFKRPEGYFAGKLIQDAGLRGYRVGDAQVSEKHCGFVINRGNATAADVRQLIRDVQQKVMDVSGVLLETEVKIVE